MKEKIEIKSKYLYIIGIIGAIICFASDLLLGFYEPKANEGLLVLFPNFSLEWASVNRIVFIIAGILGVISLLMFLIGFYGVYLDLKKNSAKYPIIFLLSAILFVSVGTLYHNVFSFTAWNYNKLVSIGVSNAYEIAIETFKSFIVVGILAAVGFSFLCVYLLINDFRSENKLNVIINPIVFMMIFVALAKILPQNKWTNGIFNMGQQSLSLLLFFSIYLIKECKTTKKMGKNRLKS